MDTLQYHVLPEDLRGAEIGTLGAGGSFERATLLGSDVTLAFTAEAAFDVITVEENSTVIFGDLITTNGVLHVLDLVLAPPAE